MKIGVIGGGVAGLVATWLLEQEAEVILFEEKPSVGGHANTTYVDVDGKQVPIESGFEFFNQKMFPHFCRLLHLLEIPTRSYQFTYSFFSPGGKNLSILPPRQENTIFWHTFSPARILKLLQLKQTIDNSYDIVATKNISVTLQQFLDQLWVSRDFKDNFFLPLFAAGWGVSPHEMGNFAAYNILSWIVENHAMGSQSCYWQEIIEGTSSYVRKLYHQLSRAEVRTAAFISEITYDGNRYTITTADGTITYVDHLIMATNALQAKKLIKNIVSLHAVYDALDKVEYIDATIAVHPDSRFMPPHQRDWSVANVLYNGTHSMLTIYKKWKSTTPLFRSWLIPGFERPYLIYSLQNYYHAKPNIAYFATQRVIAELQGKHNFWVAGIYTHDIDSHESALVSAINIVKKLQPNSDRLQLLCGNNEVLF